MYVTVIKFDFGIHTLTKKLNIFYLPSVQFSSVTHSCLTLCDPMDCSTPGFPVHCQLPGFTQTHVHWVGDAIQPFHPLTSPSPCTFNLSQHQSFRVSQFFASGGQSTGVSTSASVLSVNIQDWFPLELTGSFSLLSSGLSRVFSNTTVQKHQLYSAQPSLWSSSHIHTYESWKLSVGNRQLET